MSSVLHRTHFQFIYNSYVFAVINVSFQTVDESINCFKMLAVKHFGFQSDEKVYHRFVIHKLFLCGILCVRLCSAIECSYFAIKSSFVFYKFQWSGFTFAVLSCLFHKKYAPPKVTNFWGAYQFCLFNLSD